VHRLERAARYQLLHARQCFTDLSIDRAESRIAALLHRLAQRLDDLAFRQESAIAEQLRLRQNQVTGFAGTVLRHDPRQSIARARENLLAVRTRLDRSIERGLQSSAFALNALSARLQSLSPLAVLDRGYALVLAADGSLVRSSTQLAPGETVTTRLADGSFTSRVETITPNAAKARKKGNQPRS
jgi:exodeoxyribonuclease VII large subunit